MAVTGELSTYFLPLGSSRSFGFPFAGFNKTFILVVVILQESRVFFLQVTVFCYAYGLNLTSLLFKAIFKFCTTNHSFEFLLC